MVRMASPCRISLRWGAKDANGYSCESSGQYYSICLFKSLMSCSHNGFSLGHWHLVAGMVDGPDAHWVGSSSPLHTTDVHLDNFTHEELHPTWDSGCETKERQFGLLGRLDALLSLLSHLVAVHLAQGQPASSEAPGPLGAVAAVCEFLWKQAALVWQHAAFDSDTGRGVTGRHL